jgi:hypothetical protein
MKRREMRIALSVTSQEPPPRFGHVVVACAQQREPPHGYVSGADGLAGHALAQQRDDPCACAQGELAVAGAVVLAVRGQDVPVVPYSLA